MFYCVQRFFGHLSSFYGCHILYFRFILSFIRGLSEAILYIDNKGVENFGAFCPCKYKMYGIIYCTLLATRRLSATVTTHSLGGIKTNVVDLTALCLAKLCYPFLRFRTTTSQYIRDVQKSINDKCRRRKFIIFQFQSTITS